MKTIAVKITLILLTFISSVQDQDNIVGSWEGILNVQGTELPIVFNISEKDGNYTSTMDSPAQGATGIPVDETKFEENQLTLSLSQFGITYEATYEDGKLSGTFYQSGLELPLVMEPKKED